VTISSPCGFFEKNIVVTKATPIFFSKKYCTAFSFPTKGALSFFFSFEKFLPPIHEFKFKAFDVASFATFAIFAEIPMKK